MHDQPESTEREQQGTLERQTADESLRAKPRAPEPESKDDEE